MTTHDHELVELVEAAAGDALHDLMAVVCVLDDGTNSSGLLTPDGVVALGDVESAIARAVLDAITTSHALVKLPEPDSTRYDEGEDAEFPPADRLAWLRDMGMYGVTFWPECAGEVQVAYNDEPGEPLSAREAKRLGAVLIAAARHAETTATEQEEG